MESLIEPKEQGDIQLSSGYIFEIIVFMMRCF